MSPSTVAVNCVKFIIHTVASNKLPDHTSTVAWMARPYGRRPGRVEVEGGGCAAGARSVCVCV